MADTRKKKKSQSSSMFFAKGTRDSSYLRPLITGSTFPKEKKRKKKGLLGLYFVKIKHIKSLFYIIFNKI